MKSEYLSDTGEQEWLDGDLRTDDSPRSDVLLALRTPYGSCPLDATFGDRTWSIQKLTRSAPALSRTFTFAALAHLRLRDLDVQVRVVGRALSRVVSYGIGKRRESVEQRVPIGG